VLSQSLLVLHGFPAVSVHPPTHTGASVTQSSFPPKAWLIGWLLRMSHVFWLGEPWAARIHRVPPHAVHSVGLIAAFMQAVRAVVPPGYVLVWHDPFQHVPFVRSHVWPSLSPPWHVPIFGSHVLPAFGPSRHVSPQSLFHVHDFFPWSGPFRHTLAHWESLVHDLPQSEPHGVVAEGPVCGEHTPGQSVLSLQLPPLLPPPWHTLSVQAVSSTQLRAAGSLAAHARGPFPLPLLANTRHGAV